MRPVHRTSSPVPTPREGLRRLLALPLRPATARALLAQLPENDCDGPEPPANPRAHPLTDLDPGWALVAATSKHDEGLSPLATLESLGWWGPCGRDAHDALIRLWRHSMATALAARRFAREAGDPDPDAVSRAGLLHSLGHWAVAAVDPEWYARWLALSDPDLRLELERSDLGTDLRSLGLALAERWGCENLVVDAAWLHDPRDRPLNSSAFEPARVTLIQEARRLAELTPWAMNPSSAQEGLSQDSRVKLLIAEVQSRTGVPFIDPDATSREEQLTRSNARLRLRLAALESSQPVRDQLIEAFSSSHPTDPAESWSERAGLAFCHAPNVVSASVSWLAGRPADANPEAEKPPSSEYVLFNRGRPLASVRLWTEAPLAGPAIDETVLRAWNTWATWVDDREKLVRKLDRTLQAFREYVQSEEARGRAAKLDALAEFAAGAGHELNNPLAVIVGRAQLLLGREKDPDAARSLRTILGQAQRTHRILRDLMYVARPPDPRPRFCQPDDIVKNSVRDLRDEAEAREIRLVAEPLDHGKRVWADSDALRHLADTLVRNALEATPRGGHVRVSTKGDESCLRLFVENDGPGMTPVESAHLFDPFFCGRQAGRGLGMGLPRVARFLEQIRGEIRYQTTPGAGSTFQVRLPLDSPPPPVAGDTEYRPPAATAARNPAA